MNLSIIDWLIEEGYFETHQQVIDRYNRYLAIIESDDIIESNEPRDKETTVYIKVKTPNILMLDIISRIGQKPDLGVLRNRIGKLTYPSKITAELAADELNKIPGVMVTQIL